MRERFDTAYVHEHKWTRLPSGAIQFSGPVVNCEVPAGVDTEQLECRLRSRHSDALATVGLPPTASNELIEAYGRVLRLRWQAPSAAAAVTAIQKAELAAVKAAQQPTNTPFSAAMSDTTATAATTAVPATTKTNSTHMRRIAHTSADPRDVSPEVLVAQRQVRAIITKAQLDICHVVDTTERVGIDAATFQKALGYVADAAHAFDDALSLGTNP